MKAYTSIEQSKKLAEILPLESADMHYNNGSCRGVDYTEHFSAELMPYQEALHLMKIHKTNFMFQVIPCWSLAALLNAVDFSTITLHYNNARTDWIVSATIHDSTKHCTKYESTRALNPIDACVEMIIKLHEQKLL